MEDGQNLDGTSYQTNTTAKKFRPDSNMEALEILGLVDLDNKIQCTHMQQGVARSSRNVVQLWSSLTRRRRSKTRLNKGGFGESHRLDVPKVAGLEFETEVAAQSLLNWPETTLTWQEQVSDFPTEDGESSNISRTDSAKTNGTARQCPSLETHATTNRMGHYRCSSMRRKWKTLRRPKATIRWTIQIDANTKQARW